MHRVALLGFACAFTLGCGTEFVEMTDVETYAEVDADGLVTEIGISVDAAMADGLEQHAMTIKSFAAEVLAQTFFNHAQIMFEPHGHEATGLGEVAHFDFHFHGIPSDVREGIDCTEDKMPKEEQLPHNYEIKGLGEAPLFGSCVKQMGVHAHDKTSPGHDPDNPNPLRQALEVGYHEGDLTFIVPILHQDAVKSREVVEFEVPKPELLGRITRWPEWFKTEFDEQENTYKIHLSQFKDIQ